MSSVRDRGAIHLGLDVHKNTISVGVLEPDAELPIVEKISSDDDAGPPADQSVRGPPQVARVLRGWADRLRTGAAAGFAGGGVRGDRSVADPDRCWRAGQNRYA
jgi:hypothetical protein